MKVTVVVLGVLLFAYLGYVVGLGLYCDQVPSLRRAKKFVWIVPWCIFSYPIYLLFEDGVENRLEHLLIYIRIPEKGTLFITVISEVVATEKVVARNHRVKWQQCRSGWPKVIECFYTSNIAMT